MSKHGVSKISGNKTPTIGEKTVYKVEQWYPETPTNDRQESKVIWALYKEVEKGKLTKILQKKGKGEFTFTKKAINETYILEGYLHRPELKEPMAIEIKPQKGEIVKKDSKKEIQWITLAYSDGAKITKALSYMDKLTAVAKCQNMAGDKLIFTLWEDDEEGAGHNSKNQFITQSEPIIVDSKGYARWPFTLVNTFIKLAQQRENDTKQHEYYVTVDFNGGHKASQNVNVNNPEHKIVVEKKPKKTPKAEKKTAPQPKKESAKVSIYPASKNNTLDEKGLITKLQLLDKNKQPITDRPRFGDTIYLNIDGKNLKGKEFTVKIWEDDNTGDDDLLNEGKFIFKEDNFDRVFINLTQEMQQKGEYGNDKKNPDIGEYWTGRFQEIYVEIIFESLSVKSQTINIDIDETFKTNYDKTVTVVGKQPDKKKQEINCVCKQYDLIWGDKVSCEFRKKVIEIAKELWGEANKIRMANELMVCMALETGERFSAKYGHPKATGLIQFTETAIADMNRTGYNGGKTIDKDFLASLTPEKQLDYVKLYFQMWMNHYNKTISGALDMYLTIWCPAATGKSDDYVCYSEEKDKKDNVTYYESNKSIEYEYYDANEPIIRKRLKKDYSLGNKKIEKKDLKPRFKFWTVLGEDNKTSSFTCQVTVKTDELKKQTSNKWNDPLKRMELRGWYTESQWSPEKSDYKGRTGGKHDGLDLYAPLGTAVFSCVDGIIIDDYDSTTYGKTLTLKGDYKGKTYYFFYSHLSERVLSKSDKLIKAGTQIGKTGQTGNASGQLSKMNHLHFEVRNTKERTGGRLDPYIIEELKSSINKKPEKSKQI